MVLARVCETMVVPQEIWIGSKSDDGVFYLVVPAALFSGDGVCDCEGFRFRGTCSHLRLAETDRCQWCSYALESEEPCPVCGSPTVVVNIV